MFIKRLPKFTYHTPTSISEALDLMSEFGEKGKIVAGGTDLLVSMKKKEIVLEHLNGSRSRPCCGLPIFHVYVSIIIDATKPLTLTTFTRITPPQDLWEKMKLEDYI